MKTEFISLEPPVRFLAARKAN